MPIYSNATVTPGFFLLFVYFMKIVLIFLKAAPRKVEGIVNLEFNIVSNSSGKDCLKLHASGISSTIAKLKQPI